MKRGKLNLLLFVMWMKEERLRLMNLYPDVKTYTDFRKVYDKQLKDIDAIMVATPDHTHATIALPFMREKKHAYVEKPLDP